MKSTTIDWDPFAMGEDACLVGRGRSRFWRVERSSAQLVRDLSPIGAISLPGRRDANRDPRNREKVNRLPMTAGGIYLL